jgi:hypothetical protein
VNSCYSESFQIFGSVLLRYDPKLGRVVPRVSFTPLEIWACKSLADQIRTNKTNHPSDNTWDGVNYVDRNFKGTKGNYGVSKFLGVDFDRRLYKGPDGGWDLVHRGVRIEVKHLQDWLVFTRPESFRCRIAVLVNPVPDGESVDLMGWIRRQDFLNRHFVADLGYGPRLCVRADQLNSMSGLYPLTSEERADYKT